MEKAGWKEKQTVLAEVITMAPPIEMSHDSSSSSFFFFFFVFLPFLWPLPRHMEVPRLGVESEL